MRKILTIILLTGILLVLGACDEIKKSDLSSVKRYQECEGYYERGFIAYKKEPYLVVCTDQTGEEISLTYDQYKEISIENLKNQMISDLFPIELRYFINIMLKNINSDLIFVKTGETVKGTIEEYGYGLIIIESLVDGTVELELIDVPDDKSWDVRVYHNDLTTPIMTFDRVVDGQILTITVQSGFNTFEISSNGDTHDYELIITEIN